MKTTLENSFYFENEAVTGLGIQADRIFADNVRDGLGAVSQPWVVVAGIFVISGFFVCIYLLVKVLA